MASIVCAVKIMIFLFLIILTLSADLDTVSKCNYKCKGCNHICKEKSCTLEAVKCTNGCKPGFYGENCLVCPAGCFHSCNQTSGICFDCKDGLTGETCEKHCSPECKYKACNQNNGQCSYGCKPGFFNHRTCEKCSKGCKNTCDGYNGTCNCKEGYRGSRCEHCLPGYKRNNQVCEQCPEYCKHCNLPENCYSCTIGFLGPICKQCASGCLNKECDANSVSCRCKSGYTGKSCQNCISGWYMNKRVCRKCPDNCLHCSSVDNFQLCLVGFYGQTCEQCSIGCLNGECNAIKGNCSCKNGYTGTMCENSSTDKGTVKMETFVGIVCGLVIVILISICVFVTHRRSRKIKSEKTPHISAYRYQNHPITDEQNAAGGTTNNHYEGLQAEDRDSLSNTYLTIGHEYEGIRLEDSRESSHIYQSININQLDKDGSESKEKTVTYLNLNFNNN